MLPEDLPEGFFRHGGDYSAVCIGRIHGDAFRDCHLHIEAGKVYFEGRQNLASAGADHRFVVYEEGAVAPKAGGADGKGLRVQA